MPKKRGLVVGKDFRPPEGREAMDWCYLTVDVSDEERISIRIRKDQVSRADIGDVVVFRQHRDHDQPTQVKRIASDPSLLPPVIRTEES